MSKSVSRRYFLKIAAVTAAGSVLASCAPAATSTSQPEPGKDQPTVASKPPAKEKIELRVVSGQDTNEIEIRTKIGKSFEETRDDVTVQMDIVSGDRAESQLTMIAGGNPPDVLYLNDTFEYVFAHKGLLMDLDLYITRDNFDFAPYLKEAVESNRYQGKMVAMPFEVSVIGVLYNKNLFDAANVPYPSGDIKDTSWNWDSLVETAKKLTDPTQNQFGFSMDAWMIPNLMLCYDQRYLSNNKEITADTKATIDTEKTAAAFQYWLDMQDVHHVAPTAAMSQEISGIDRFMSGKVAMYPFGRWLNTFRTIKEFEWDVAPMPAPKDGHPASVLYILNYAIYSKSKKADMAWEFLKFINTKGPQTINVESGMAVAVLEEINASPDFLNNAPPANNKAYADILPYAKLWDNNEANYMQYANQVLGQFISGERKDVKGILQEAGDGINKALDEYRAENK